MTQPVNVRIYLSSGHVESLSITEEEAIELTALCHRASTHERLNRPVVWKGFWFKPGAVIGIWTDYVPPTEEQP